MPIMYFGNVCAKCDWPHVDPASQDLAARSLLLTEKGWSDPDVPPRSEWPFHGDGIEAVYVDRRGRLCFEYA